MYLRPYIDFSTQRHRPSATALSASAASRTARSYFLRNFWWLATLSGDTPITSTPALRKSGARREKSLASTVQPDVSSLG